MQKKRLLWQSHLTFLISIFKLQTLNIFKNISSGILLVLVSYLEYCCWVIPSNLASSVWEYLQDFRISFKLIIWQERYGNYQMLIHYQFVEKKNRVNGHCYVQTMEHRDICNSLILDTNSC